MSASDNVSRSIVTGSYPGFRCSVSDNETTIRVLGVSGDLTYRVKEDELFNKGDVLAVVGGMEVKAPCYATVYELSKREFLNDGDVLMRIRDVNPTYSCYFAPPLEVVGREKEDITGLELYRRIRKNMNLPSKKCKNIREVVEYLTETVNKEEKK